MELELVAGGLLAEAPLVGERQHGGHLCLGLAHDLDLAVDEILVHALGGEHDDGLAGEPGADEELRALGEELLEVVLLSLDLAASVALGRGPRR